MPIFFDGEIYGTDLPSALRTAPDVVVLQCVDSAAAAKATEEGGSDLPLHTALRHGRSEQVIAALVEAHPKAVEIRGRDGLLPLHLACALPSVDAAWEDGAIRLEQTPTQWVAVVRLLLRTHPMACGAASQTAGLCRLPLHFAAARHAPPEAVRLLCEAHPPGAAATDAAGDTPLHLLAASGAETEATAARRWDREAASVVARLLSTAADGPRRRGATGHTPLDVALQRGALPARAVATLVAADMPLTRDGAPVELHAHSWAKVTLASSAGAAEALPAAATVERDGAASLRAVAAAAARLVLDEHGFDRQAAQLQRLAPSLARAARHAAGAGAGGAAARDQQAGASGVGRPGTVLLLLGGAGLALAVLWQTYGGALLETVATVPLHVRGLVAAVVATLGALVAAGWAMSTVP